jgi:hypothetical protein
MLVECRLCLQQQEVDDAYANQPVACRHCGRQFIAAPPRKAQLSGGCLAALLVLGALIIGVVVLCVRWYQEFVRGVGGSR